MSDFRRTSLTINGPILFSILFVVSCLVGLIILLKSMSSTKGGNYLIPTYQEGHIVRVVPQVELNIPLFNDSEVLDITNEAMVETLSLSFDDYQSSMSNASKLYFTQSGWNSFSKKIKDIGLYETLFIDKEIIKVIPRRAPFMLFSGTVDGPVNGKIISDYYYTWRVVYQGRVTKKPLFENVNPEVLNSRRKAPQVKVADISLTIDLQRVPKGKGARAIKIIDTSDWDITWRTQ